MPAGVVRLRPTQHAHTFKVISEAPGKKLNLFAPAAMVGFFEELAEAEATGQATPELLDAIAARHHMHVLGPVPDAYL